MDHRHHTVDVLSLTFSTKLRDSRRSHLSSIASISALPLNKSTFSTRCILVFLTILQNTTKRAKILYERFSIRDIKTTEGKCSRNTNIGHHKIGDLPIARHKDAEPIESSQDSEEDQSGPGHVGLKGAAKPRVLVLETLDYLRSAEPGEGPAYRHPGKQTSNRSKICELKTPLSV